MHWSDLGEVDLYEVYRGLKWKQPHQLKVVNIIQYQIIMYKMYLKSIWKFNLFKPCSTFTWKSSFIFNFQLLIKFKLKCTRLDKLPIFVQKCISRICIWTKLHQYTHKLCRIAHFIFKTTSMDYPQVLAKCLKVRAVVVQVHRIPRGSY